MKKSFALLTAMTFLFIGCASRTPVTSKALNFKIISPLVKISDAGFIYRYPNRTNLQIYSSGVAILSLNIKDEKVCMNGACDDELSFNSRFFKKEHYKGFLNAILLKKPLYNGSNLVKNECGFIQEIETISYSVCNNEVSFSDRASRVKIDYKELD